MLMMVGLMLAALPASSTVLMYLGIDQLTDQSSAVIQGQVVRQRVVAEQDFIWTDSYVKISESLKGKLAPGKIVVLRQLGGETPRRGMKVAGMARFAQGEQVLVLARAVKDGIHVPVGACLGKYRLYRGANGSMRAQRHCDASFARFDRGGKFRLEHSQAMHRESDLTHAQLVSKIAARLANGGVR